MINFTNPEEMPETIYCDKCHCDIDYCECMAILDIINDTNRRLLSVPMAKDEINRLLGGVVL